MNYRAVHSTLNSCVRILTRKGSRLKIEWLASSAEGITWRQTHKGMHTKSGTPKGAEIPVDPQKFERLDKLAWIALDGKIYLQRIFPGTIVPIVPHRDIMLKVPNGKHPALRLDWHTGVLFVRVVPIPASVYKSRRVWFFAPDDNKVDSPNKYVVPVSWIRWHHSDILDVIPKEQKYLMLTL